MYCLEVCVDTVESAISAAKGGADRIELCANLIIGGTSPSTMLFKMVRGLIDVPINVLLRPRFGDFLYSDYEFEIIKNEIKLFKNLGADGIVIGVLKSDGTIDEPRMCKLVETANALSVTLHRCFDVTRDPFEALETAQNLGIDRILTSGQKSKAEMALPLLDELQKISPIKIMAGSGVNYHVVQKMLNETVLSEFHLSGKKTIESGMVYRKEGVPMGLSLASEFEKWETDENCIREIKSLILGQGVN